MLRGAGQSLVLSKLCDGEHEEERQSIEVRICRICGDDAAVLEVLLPENVFVERKETLDGVRALFKPAPA
jgi:hypothetical protein